MCILTRPLWLSSGEWVWREKDAGEETGEVAGTITQDRAEGALDQCGGNKGVEWPEFQALRTAAPDGQGPRVKNNS